MRFFRTAWWVRQMFPQYTWKIDTQHPTIYLTFDDGPIPEVTEYVLDQLKQYQAKATFFCVGDNVRKHPDIYQQVVVHGHRTGNHTYHHLNGWKTEDKEYLANIEQCYQTMNAASHSPHKPLFRPPYGKVKRSQMKSLVTRYQVIMWDVLTYDFDPTLEPEVCLQKAIDYTTSGSIVVFHDSVKSIDKLRYVLPRYLAHFAEQGFGFEAIGDNI
ncbi:polysaccharide deacetylase family protein [uncultured Microscilla sp.]|uniref:polysaccharide deacetylase family protein n=1 Tax=uncultured Microscilla sp. TaxID=432653 RepID=UPI002605F391|nr:polysaccharide deacetylase family protein [uncultured Microscilla sp.]